MRGFGCIVAAVAMMAMFVSFCFGEIMFIAERLPLKGDRSLSDVPWPMPANWSRDATTMTLHPTSLQFQSNMADCDVIDQAIARYRGILKLTTKDNTPAGDSDIKTVEITVKNVTCEELPYLDMDESYSLVTRGNKVQIDCNSVWGALRGLETFSQLVYEDNETVRMKNWTIADHPRFSHRGFMVDTSRHYLPLSIIKKHLDAMTWSKLNVLHWHIVDAQSFPFFSERYPQLSQKGAFTPNHVYRPEDVSEVIEYARLRGIRVIPEFDTPGHAHSWGKAMPDLLTPCWVDGQPMRAEYGSHAESENFDPTQNSTYTILGNLMQEVKTVFRDQFLHAGMDEAHYMCWNSSQTVAQFMRDHGISNLSQFEQYYVTKALDVISDTGKKVIIWQDPLDNGAKVDKQTVIEIWKNERDKLNCHPDVPDVWQKYAALVAKAGNSIIVSSCWYLNYICYGEDWRRFYECDPLSFSDEPSERDLVIGGEACLWAEFVDGTNLLQRAWPRAAAVAERLWSPDHVVDTDTAAFRLDNHRCRLLRRGVPASPILPGYCGDYDYGMDTEDTMDHTTTPCPTGTSAGKRVTSPLLLCLMLVNLVKSFVSVG